MHTVWHLLHVGIAQQHAGLDTNSLRLGAERKNSALPAGGTASGKTTVCDQIMQRLHDQCVVMISQDSFYRGLTDAELANVQGKSCCAVLSCTAPGSLSWRLLSCHPAPADYNFDSPDAFDVEALVECLANLKVRLAWLISLPNCCPAQQPGQCNPAGHAACERSHL